MEDRSPSLDLHQLNIAPCVCFFKDPGHSGLRGPSSWILDRGVSPSGARDPLIIPSDRVPKSLFIDPIIPTHYRAPDPLLFFAVYFCFL